VSYPNDASEGFAVNWRSDEQVTGTLLILGTDEAEVLAADTPEETETLSWRWGHHMLFTDSGGTTTRLHEVHVCGLSENSAYFYKVGAPGAWSAVYSVTTAPRKGSASPVRFAVFGDSRGLVGDVWPTTVQKAAEFGADFALFTGDAVATGTSQSQWDKFWKAAAGGFVVEEGLASLPLMVANGNHDALALNYLAQFAMPQSASTGEVGDGEQWYSFDYGPVHVVVLDDSVSSTVIEGAEADWLESDLAAVDRTETPWVFVAHHKPLYTCGSNHGPSLSSRAAWQPIYDAHGVDMVFTGHNHAYERTVPIRGLSGGEGVAAGRGANGRAARRQRRHREWHGVHPHGRRERGALRRVRRLRAQPGGAQRLSLRDCGHRRHAHRRARDEFRDRRPHRLLRVHEVSAVVAWVFWLDRGLRPRIAARATQSSPSPRFSGRTRAQTKFPTLQAVVVIG
jgi:hypothetical protein